MPPVLECEICYYEKQVGPKVPFHPLGGGTLVQLWWGFWRQKSGELGGCWVDSSCDREGYGEHSMVGRSV